MPNNSLRVGAIVDFGKLGNGIVHVTFGVINVTFKSKFFDTDQRVKFAATLVFPSFNLVSTSAKLIVRSSYVDSIEYTCIKDARHTDLAEAMR